MLPVFGLPGDFEIMNADTESSVDVARSRAEKLVNEGANILVGAFDSGQSAAIAQVAEQKGVPYVINIAAAPPLTDPGSKYVFPTFPPAPMLSRNAWPLLTALFPPHRITPQPPAP